MINFCSAANIQRLSLVIGHWARLRVKRGEGNQISLWSILHLLFDMIHPYIWRFTISRGDAIESIVCG